MLMLVANSPGTLSYLAKRGQRAPLRSQLTATNVVVIGSLAHVVAALIGATAFKPSRLNVKTSGWYLRSVWQAFMQPEAREKLSFFFLLFRPLSHLISHRVILVINVQDSLPQVQPQALILHRRLFGIPISLW